MKLTMAQVIDLARQAGLSGEGLAMAGAIARAESGLNTDAVGVNGPTSGCPNGSRDLGLWQINDCYNRIANAFDPVTNAQAMARISAGGKNWKPWSTYHNGAYKKFLAEAEAVAGTGGTPLWQRVIEGLLIGAGVTWAWQNRERIAGWWRKAS